MSVGVRSKQFNQCHECAITATDDIVASETLKQIGIEFFGNDPKHYRLYSSRKLNVISSAFSGLKLFCSTYIGELVFFVAPSHRTLYRQYSRLVFGGVHISKNT